VSNTLEIVVKEVVTELVIEGGGQPNVVVVEESVGVLEVAITGPQGPRGLAGPAGAQGPAGPAGPEGAAGSGDKSYTHHQLAPSTVWTVAHNLGKYPAVEVVDSGGTVVEGDIAYLDANTLTLTFSVQFGGVAYCN
jgi:hypothetical protein